ncbi:hypothetical protein [Tenacibaculum salmonis]|uniref:hypothetical protein n=2 Tax=Tenacibaculum TaxID=104267 RepID=UPI0034DE1D9E
MKFFEFKNKVFQWTININQEDYGKVIAPMNDNIWLAKESLPIKMRMIDAYEDIDLWEGETPFVDVLGWYTDITTGDIKPKKGTYIVISKKIKEVLEKYRLPEHRFYPISLHCKELKQSNSDYFLFHVLVKHPTVGDYRLF